MMLIRKSEERGFVNHGWLQSFHTFSFSDYYDPKHIYFRALRVINEDRIAPGMGFGTHPHQDMEIITYVLEGALEHKDSLGTGSVIRPGDLQRMSAGTGVAHSEYNQSDKESVHLLQIWIFPSQKGIKPSYEQKNFPADQKQGKLCLIGSPNGASGSVTIHQDVRLFATQLEKGQKIVHDVAPDRHVWVQVARGEGVIGDCQVSAGDGVAVSNEKRLEIQSASASEFLLFDLP